MITCPCLALISKLVFTCLCLAGKPLWYRLRGAFETTAMHVPINQAKSDILEAARLLSGKMLGIILLNPTPQNVSN